MNIEPGTTYVSHNSAFFITIPKRRDLNSYPREIQQLLGNDLREQSTTYQTRFNEGEYILQLNVRIYATDGNKHRVYTKYTTRENDFTAIPPNTLNRLVGLRQISYQENITDLVRIQEIITNGYRIDPPL